MQRQCGPHSEYDNKRVRTITSGMHSNEDKYQNWMLSNFEQPSTTAIFPGGNTMLHSGAFSVRFQRSYNERVRMRSDMLCSTQQMS